MGLILCGVDPGLSVTGYAVIAEENGGFRIADAGVCRSNTKAELAQRLAQVEGDFFQLLNTLKPSIMAVEQLYAHYKHPRTAILMGHARGVMLSVAARLGIEVRHYSATQVKRFLTGNGHASKLQVQRAVMAAMCLPRIPQPPDLADALSIALCCAHDVQRPTSLGGRR